MRLEAILKAIDQAGFEIRYEKLYHFRPDEVESLYIKHRNAPFFDDLVDAYTAYGIIYSKRLEIYCPS